METLCHKALVLKNAAPDWVMGGKSALWLHFLVDTVEILVQNQIFRHQFGTMGEGDDLLPSFMMSVM